MPNTCPICAQQTITLIVIPNGCLRMGINGLGNMVYIQAVDIADRKASLWCPTKISRSDSQQIPLLRAAIRFLLHVTVSDSQVHIDAVTFIEPIARLLARYRQFDNLYTSGQPQLQGELEAALAKMYAFIFELLSKGSSHLQG